MVNRKKTNHGVLNNVLRDPALQVHVEDPHQICDVRLARHRQEHIPENVPDVIVIDAVCVCVCVCV